LRNLSITSTDIPNLVFKINHQKINKLSLKIDKTKSNKHLSKIYPIKELFFENNLTPFLNIVERKTLVLNVIYYNLNQIQERIFWSKRDICVQTVRIQNIHQLSLVEVNINQYVEIVVLPFQSLSKTKDQLL
jgi:hypothetical protein